MSEPKQLFTIIKENKLLGKDGIEYEIPELPNNVERVKTQEEIDHWKKVNNPEEFKSDIATRVYSMDEILQVIQDRGNKVLHNPNTRKQIEFIIDEFNRPIIELLTHYFTNSTEFENQSDSHGTNYSLKKSIMLCSKNYGTGKTLLMKIFSRGNNWNDDLRFNSFFFQRIQNCKKIVSTYRKDGEIVFTPFEEVNEKLKLMSVCVLDEVGREDTAALHYGNKCNVIERILQERYDMFIDHGIKTHITTNIISGDDFEKLYGGFIRSRMREMYNVIEMPGNDRRK